MRTVEDGTMEKAGVVTRGRMAEVVRARLVRTERDIATLQHVVEHEYREAESDAVRAVFDRYGFLDPGDSIDDAALAIKLYRVDTLRSQHAPAVGDVVRVEEDPNRRVSWMHSLPADGVIGGMVGSPIAFGDDPRFGMVTFGCAYSCFRGPHVTSFESLQGVRFKVSASGGPGCMFLVGDLEPTDEIVDRTFWRWRDWPGAGNGVEYTLPVRVWTWRGQESGG